MGLGSFDAIYGVKLGRINSKRFSSNIIQKCNMAQNLYCAIVVTLMPVMFCRVVEGWTSVRLNIGVMIEAWDLNDCLNMERGNNAGMWCYIATLMRVRTSSVRMNRWGGGRNRHVIKNSERLTCLIKNYQMPNVPCQTFYWQAYQQSL